jgi:hypothetical protein
MESTVAACAVQCGTDRLFRDLSSYEPVDEGHLTGGNLEQPVRLKKAVENGYSRSGHPAWRIYARDVGMIVDDTQELLS